MTRNALAGIVQIPRSLLDEDTKRLVRMARALSQHVLDQLENGINQDEDYTKAVTSLAKAADSASRVVLGLLAEMREREKLARTAPPLTDEEYAEHLVSALRSLAPETRAALVEKSEYEDVH